MLALEGPEAIVAFSASLLRRGLGLVGNWNRCVQLSQGEWVKFVFWDDIILPDCLTEMPATAARTQMPIVTCVRDFIFEPGCSNEDR
jgi:hypothetical protein